MGTSFKVTIIVDADGPGRGDNPSQLHWHFGLHANDNPRFYGESLLEAIEEAARAASSNVAQNFPIPPSA